MAQTLYINPATGSDSAAGSQSAPLKTISFALKQAQVGTKIQLASGTYNIASGEIFPLGVPSGVIIVGNETNQGSGILIEGSGVYTSRSFGRQNVTLSLTDNAELRGATVTCPAIRGTGVWIESSAATVANCTLTKCQREGIFIAGTANPVILNNIFTENSGNGLTIANDAKGEIRGNSCFKTGYGITISDNATSLIVDNKIFENRAGMVISGDSQPVLRNNLIEKNTDDGATVITNALPDMGNSSQPGGNILRYNGQFDLQSTSSNKLVCVGNQIAPGRVKGSIELVNNQVPPPNPTPTPTPTPTPAPTP